MHYAPHPTLEQLACLRDALAPAGKVEVERRIKGGLGCTTDVLRVAEPGRAPARMILRRYDPWYALHKPRAAEIEFAVLKHLKKHGVPAPEPVWVDRQATFETPAMVIGFISGEVQKHPKDPMDYASQLAKMLARLHDVPRAGLPADLTDYNAAEAAFLSASEPPDTMKAHRLGSLLWECQRRERGRVELDTGGFLHGDYWPGNTLWRGQKLAAVLDFEEVGVGDPALDVAIAAVNLKLEPWPEASDHFVSVYRAETGRALETLRFWEMKELRRPMPDIANWLPSFQHFHARADVTADELRAEHERLIREALG